MKKARVLVTLIVVLTMVFGTGITVFGAHWADSYYTVLKEKNILNADFGTMPETQKNQPITREEFFSLVVCAIHGRQVSASQESHFADFNTVSPTLSGYISKAYQEKILTGVEASGLYYVNPSKPITRQEAATTLGRALGISANLPTEFIDNDKIAKYAKDYVAGCEKSGILSGYPTGEFMPTGNITWAESVKVVATALEKNLVTPLKVSVVAGNSAKGIVNGNPATSSFNQPSGLTILQGNLYIADTGNNKIRKFSGKQVSDLAGRVLGYDLYNNAVNGYRDDKVAKSLFAAPADITTYKNTLVIADSANHSIRQIIEDTSYTLSGNGKAGYKDGNKKEAQFKMPMGVCADSEGNIYIADTGNNLIRKIDGKGNVTTIAGKSGNVGYKDGNAKDALFNSPTKLAFSEGVLYVSDSGNNRIRMIKGDAVTTLAGSGTEKYEGTTDYIGDYKDGAATVARFNNPTGIAVDTDGTVYVADTGNSVIRGIKNGQVFTVSGLTKASKEALVVVADFVNPVGLYLSGNTLYVTDALRNTISTINLK